MDRFAKYRNLVVLAQAGSYGAAAHELGISQPALTRSIQALEASVGARLVDRGGKVATLTPVGELLVARARPILRDLDDLEHEIEQSRGRRAGRLSLGAGPYASALIIPSLLEVLGRHHPRLRLGFEMESWRLLVGRLKERHLDLVVAEASEAERDLELRVVLLPVQPAYLTVRAGHPLAGRPSGAEQIARFPFAVPTLPYRIIATFQGVFGIRWRPNLQCDDLYVLTEFVKRTDAVMLATPAILADPQLTRLEFDDLPVESRFGIIVAADRTPSRATRLAMDTLLSLAGKRR